jgi:hypothetical protein
VPVSSLGADLRALARAAKLEGTDTLLVRFSRSGRRGSGLQIRPNEATDCVKSPLGKFVENGAAHLFRVLLYFLRFVQQNRGDSTASEGDIMLIYRCPTTAKIVQSGIDASEADVRRLSALRLSLWCPYCQDGHAILGKDIQVDANAVRPAG